MLTRRWVGIAAPAIAAAALLLTPGTGAAQPPDAPWYYQSLVDPFGPNSYVYSPGYAGPGGILENNGFYGPGYVGDLWYYPNVHWPARSWYMTYNAGPGGYRVFYPNGRGESYFYSHRTGIRPWETIEPPIPEDRSDWQFPRDGTPTRHSRQEEEESAVKTGYPVARLQDPSTALIEVKLPVADAEVYLEGKKMNQKGTTRLYLSPPLASRRDYLYVVRAKWTGKDGTPQDITRRIIVRSGATVHVDFTTKK
jgi:uncharacterized protein (TIGR03000 family)